MKHSALVVDHRKKDAQFLRQVAITMGHTADVVGSHAEACKLLKKKRYTYALIELAIPAEGKRGARAATGLNLIGHIRRMKKTFPILVTMSSPRQRNDKALLRTVFTAIEIGATKFVLKPFDGDELDRIVARMLNMDKNGDAAEQDSRSSRSTRKRASADTSELELAFNSDRVALCGVDVCGEKGSSVIRRILDALAELDQNGNYRACSGRKLASLLEVKGGQNTIAGAIRDFRVKCRQELLDELGLQVKLSDVIASTRQGYRLSKGVVIRNGSKRVRPSVGKKSASPEDLNERQLELLAMMKQGQKIRIATVARRLHCSERTVRRQLAGLRKRSMVEFVGSARNGYFRLTR